MKRKKGQVEKNFNLDSLDRYLLKENPIVYFFSRIFPIIVVISLGSYIGFLAYKEMEILGILCWVAIALSVSGMIVNLIYKIRK